MAELEMVQRSKRSLGGFSVRGKMNDDIVLSGASYRDEDAGATTFTLTPEEVEAAFGVPSAKPLGAGAFGETWRLDYADGTHRAGKVILSPTYPTERLAREVEGLRRVSNPHVVALHDARTVSLPRGDRAALVFEYIAGGDVDANLPAGARVGARDVAGFARGVLVGLEALHAVDTVHRDVKPANIAVRDGDWNRPVLLDLGLARVLDRASITAYPALMGTAWFMAPEQLRQERARKAADVFAVGVVAHLMLTGKHPFFDGAQNLSLTEAVRLIEAGPAPLPATVPAALGDIVRRLVHPDPADRGSARRGAKDLTDVVAAIT
ncbi:hypothetical protein GCM10009867_17100 [Pedococcus aerophilus]|uniref:non-specific serine/threonine protein kinase n=2 Tax=Pedococcus aerophilus TaxID=436356 RepID=A0ABN3ULW0_9MICO